ncbi:MAG: hypothetical protein JST10_02565 [Bacteroidetes bacterium]|nr:hypothetical protein [Bacteroidota bacterium]
MTPHKENPFLQKNNFKLHSEHLRVWKSSLQMHEIELHPAPAFINDICLPSKLYMLSGVQNDIFVEPLVKRWRPYNDVVQFSGTARFQRRLQRVASINKPIDGSSVTITLINEDRFDTIKSISSEIVTGNPGIGEDSVIVSIIGDSFTNGAFFKDALITKGYVPKIQMVGLRNTLDCPGQYDEGRGGWTLSDYFKVTTGRTESYNGFWQPEGVYKYWGSTAFWKLANEIRLNPKGKWSFDESYFTGRFDTQSLLFDVNTGYKTNPVVNDIMFDNTKNYYIKYNGSKWIQTDYSDYKWSFNYGKYLSMWKLPKPSIVAEFLGLNDFRSMKDPEKIDFSEWNMQLNTIATSYLKAVPSGKFVIMIPCSTCGILDNMAGYFTTKQNACMWEVRRNIIENFDRKESENIYIVDAAIAIDNLYGYNFTTSAGYTQPYSEYKGTDSILVQTGNPHPYPNYPAMGVSLAAFIQKYR